jgi:hypothetical protein
MAAAKAVNWGDVLAKIDGARTVVEVSSLPALQRPSVSRATQCLSRRQQLANGN